MKIELTDRQKEILKFIQKFLHLNGYPPTIREIGREFGISSTFGVKRHLDALEKKGYLTIGNNVSRGLCLTGLLEPNHASASLASEYLNQTEVFQIPVLGRVAAGIPVCAIENIEGSISVDSNLLKKSTQCFALKIKGDSMINAGIFEGDLVIVSPQKYAENGEIIVALIGDEATVKRFHRSGESILLIAENVNYKPIIVNNREDFSIIGKVIGVQRWYN